MRLVSSESNGEPDPKLAFGIEKLELAGALLDADIYVEAFGSRITRPRKANYGLAKEDFPILADWLLQYLNKPTEVHSPYHTLEPAFVLKLSPASETTTEVSVRLQAYGTVDMYFNEDTGPAIVFEASNRDIAEFRQQLISEAKSLIK